MTANNPDSVQSGEQPIDANNRGVSETGGSPSSDGSADDTELDHAARAELLAEENRRLRSEYARAQQSKYRNTAYGLGFVGVLAVVGGLLFPAAQEVLFALGAVGLFGGVLTLYLTPGQFVTADVGERVYAAMAANETAIVAELGLTETRVYVPDGEHSARLYIPQHSEFDVPDDESGPILVADESRGLLLDATGAYLFGEFERALSGDLSETPTTLGAQLADGIVEQFELASAVEPDIDSDDGRATFEVGGSAFGDLDRVDHPVVSFLAVGIALGLDEPVAVELDRDDDDWLVTCRWNVGDAK